jgi:hypothetical protein
MHDDATSEPGRRPSAGTADDMVEYLVLTVPARSSLERVASSLRELAEAETVRILDLVVLERDMTGSVEIREIEELDEMRFLGPADRPTERLLSTHDIELVSSSVPHGSVGVIVVTQDRWAAPLSKAVSLAGGRVVAGERIPAARIASAGQRPADGGGPDEPAL